MSIISFVLYKKAGVASALVTQHSISKSGKTLHAVKLLNPCSVMPW